MFIHWRNYWKLEYLPSTSTCCLVGAWFTSINTAERNFIEFFPQLCRTGASIQALCSSRPVYWQPQQVCKPFALHTRMYWTLYTYNCSRLITFSLPYNVKFITKFRMKNVFLKIINILCGWCTVVLYVLWSFEIGIITSCFLLFMFL